MKFERVHCARETSLTSMQGQEFLMVSNFVAIAEGIATVISKLYSLRAITNLTDQGYFFVANREKRSRHA